MKGVNAGMQRVNSGGYRSQGIRRSVTNQGKSHFYPCGVVEVPCRLEHLPHLPKAHRASGLDAPKGTGQHKRGILVRIKPTIQEREVEGREPPRITDIALGDRRRRLPILENHRVERCDVPGDRPPAPAFGEHVWQDYPNP